LPDIGPGALAAPGSFFRYGLKSRGAATEKGSGPLVSIASFLLPSPPDVAFDQGERATPPPGRHAGVRARKASRAGVVNLTTPVALTSSPLQTHRLSVDAMYVCAA